MSIWLIMKASDGFERTFPLQKPTTIIGRETNCDVRVPIPSVSQKHCKIIVQDGVVRLQDLQSEHGTYHNGERVQEARLDHDDRLTVGPVTFVVRRQGNGNAETTPEIIIERQVAQHMLDGIQPPPAT